MSEKKVKISHPERGTTMVMPSSLRVWTDRGWTVEDTNPPINASVSQSDSADVAESDVTAASGLPQTAAQAEPRS